MKSKKRVIFVIALLLVFTIYMYISIRGEYLQILGIGQEYVEMFKENLKQRGIIFVISFAFVFSSSILGIKVLKKISCRI